MVDTTIVSGSGPPNNNSGTGVRFRDLFPSVDSAQAETFLEALFHGTRRYAGLTFIGRGAGNRRAISGFDTWVTGRRVLAEDDRFWDIATDDWYRWDTYAQVCTVRERPPTGQRGKTKDVAELPGLFADLDVKSDENSFRSREELDAFLGKLPPATMVVDTGSGGCHAYWLYDRPYVVPDWQQSAELDGWYDYLTHVAGQVGRGVDHVQGYSRILRVPGTVRWPRPDRTGKRTWAPVKLVHSDGPRYTREELLELTEPHRVVAARQHEYAQTEWTGQRNAQLSWLESMGLARAAQSILEKQFNSTQDWGALLLAAGWQLCRDNRGGSGPTACRFWTRPGKRVEDGHSVSTDYRDYDVMYVYTTEPDIESCIIPGQNRFNRVTTKYLFALKFLFAGDEARLIRAIHRGKGRVA